MRNLANPGRSGRFAAAAIVAFGLAVVSAFAVFGRWSGPSALRSVAVLPLEAAAGDPTAVALGVAISDSVRNRLSRVGSFTVVEAGSGADAVVSGAVSREGGRIRVRVRLVRSRDGRQIWAETFDATDADLSRVEEAMADAVLSRLRPRDRAATGSSPGT